ncbi:MAG: hypothetical protein GY950_36115 [bacterium]|nr:hypothetical protein [bacterium]
MKKTLIFVSLILMTSVFISAEKFMFTIYSDYLTLADTAYKDEYGGKKFLPEAKLSFKVKGNFYLWGSVGFLPASYKWNEWSNKGFVDPDIDSKNSSQKMFFSGGLGFYAGYIAKNDMAVKLELGACATSHTVKITSDNTTTNQSLRSEKTTETGIGITANLGVTYGIFENVFTEASIGYMYVWENKKDEIINGGGLRLALGLGLKF